MTDVCDVCGHAVTFCPVTRMFTHVEPTRCRGIDGVVLSAQHSDRLESRRAAPAMLRLSMPSLAERPWVV